jgi:hypothetical protein
MEEKWNGREEGKINVRKAPREIHEQRKDDRKGSGWEMSMSTLLLISVESDVSSVLLARNS